MFSASAQRIDPVSWKYESKKTANNTYQIIITATVQQPWHIYSQTTGDGPVPTKFEFKKNPLITFTGKVEEKGNLQKTYDPNFKSEVKYFSNSVQFIQNIQLKTKVKTSVSGTVEYMVCNDEQCLPPTKKTFTIDVE
jgi:thiol:disulfide interchange protein DsbD